MEKLTFCGCSKNQITVNSLGVSVPGAEASCSSGSYLTEIMQQALLLNRTLSILHRRERWSLAESPFDGNLRSANAQQRQFCPVAHLAGDFCTANMLNARSPYLHHYCQPQFRHEACRDRCFGRRTVGRLRTPDFRWRLDRR